MASWPSRWPCSTTNGSLSSRCGCDTTLDAEYLAVTRLQADALVTIDPGLAAKARDLVPVAPLAALTED